jgi:hypothetical protein
MTNLRSNLLAVQYAVACVAYVGATLIHEETALLGLLTVPLIALKLARVIVWSWLWVLLPIWGAVVVWALVILGTCAYLRWVSSEHRTTDIGRARAR